MNSSLTLSSDCTSASSSWLRFTRLAAGLVDGDVDADEPVSGPDHVGVAGASSGIVITV